ncbi:9-O-acetylesterase [Dysgonomonadaceae bacterium zrk40]|nr:9-O-acetylesterase [Dysgonomonadaceae bacterium zrk40]
MKKQLFFSLFVGIFLFASPNLFSQMSVSALFSDHMVLQQKSKAPIWGNDSPGSKVEIVVSWNEKSYEALTNREGKWQTTIETPAAGGPYQIVINGSKSITFSNVLIGEVWICSGQSNMEMPFAGWGKIFNFEKEIAAANHPRLRLLQVDKTTSTYPLELPPISSGGWQECSPKTIPYFSATAYFFGRDLLQELDVPVGLIHTSWGGTMAEAWTSLESLQLMPDFKALAEEYAALPHDKEQQKAYFEEKFIEWHQQVNALDFGIENGKVATAAASFPEEGWSSVTLPGPWENNGLPEFDGIAWYRKRIEIPEDWEGQDLILSLGAVDDNEETWFNGEKIGATEGAGTARRYHIPGAQVKRGEAILTVRVLDTGGLGGFMGDESDLYIAPAGKETLRENLNGEWLFRTAVNLNDVGMPPQRNPESPHYPTTLYNAMIAPLVPYTIRGAIWYQGESNAGRAYQYRTLFPLMIRDWRTKWGFEFPFYFVQLANYMQRKDEPAASGWAELREAQLQTLHLHNTGMAVTIDIGDAKDIHPKNKQDVGKRLALLARHHTYGEDLVAEGPRYNSYRIGKDCIRISFKPSTSGLTVKGEGNLKGFTIAGPDRIFHWAEAYIEGDEVVVRSAKVPFPVAVRYGWADNPECNLVNEAGLPASPFRTDDWPGTTIQNR